jgi:hypothetical protein
MLEAFCENHHNSRARMSQTTSAVVVQVPRSTLSRYVGTYDTVNDGDKHVVHVTVDDATLWVDYDGNGKEPLIPLSPARFSWSGSIVEFSPGAEGTLRIVIQYAEGAEPGQRRK